MHDRQDCCALVAGDVQSIKRWVDVFLRDVVYECMLSYEGKKLDPMETGRLNGRGGSHFRCFWEEGILP